MKKTIIFLMVLVLAFSVVGCTNKEEKDDVRIDIPINSIDSIAVDDAEVNDNDLVNEVLSGDSRNVWFLLDLFIYVRIARVGRTQ